MIGFWSTQLEMFLMSLILAGLLASFSDVIPKIRDAA
jgi:hypothetical protein